MPRLASTMAELEGWRKHVFTHLGWMVLAKAKGMDTKVKAYKESVNALCESIKQHMSEYENHDKKHDLKVLMMEVEILKGRVNKMF